MLESIFTNHWTWWLIAVSLMIVETIFPGSFLLWVGIAAGAVGFCDKAYPTLTLPQNLLLFAFFSVLSVLLGKWLMKKIKPRGRDSSEINLRADHYVGKIVTLTQPIQDRKGRINLDGTLWVVEGEDAKVGTRVEIIGREGIVLKVKPCQEKNFEENP